MIDNGERMLWILGTIGSGGFNNFGANVCCIFASVRLIFVSFQFLEESGFLFFPCVLPLAKLFQNTFSSTVNIVKILTVLKDLRLSRAMSPVFA